MVSRDIYLEHGETFYNFGCRFAETLKSLKTIRHQNDKKIIKFLAHTTSSRNYRKMKKDGKMRFCIEKNSTWNTAGFYTIPLKSFEFSEYYIYGRILIILDANILDDLIWGFNTRHSYGLANPQMKFKDKEKTLEKFIELDNISDGIEIVFFEDIDFKYTRAVYNLYRRRYLFKKDFIK